MTAYYNENDPFAAAWLRQLIAAGHIAAGDVDERDIRDIRPHDLNVYTQCHFFAGIGVWSYALRRAGVADDREVWTGSCPCQPFSAADQGGGFADERHLWPAFHHLINVCRPELVLGEQVASKDGLAWLDLVQADLEGTGYAATAIDLCVAGVGAPHIRQRLWWVGYADSEHECTARDQAWPADLGGLGGLGVADGARSQSGWFRSQTARHGYSADTTSAPGELANIERPGPVNGFWRASDWLFCRDGKWRPVEPGTFPLAHGAAARGGRLRGYGNAINAEAATEFIIAVEDARLDRLNVVN